MWTASLWQCIENVFWDHRARFKLFAVPHYLHLFNQGVKVQRMSMVSFFILNFFIVLMGHGAASLGMYRPHLKITCL
jgi:hypothetical protein